MTLWLFLVGAFAGAQTASAPPMPSPAAMALARAMSDQPVPTEVLDRTADNIAGNLLNTSVAWQGPGCDPESPACSAAAKRLGREAASTALEDARARRDQLLAIIIGDTMTSVDIVQATKFIRSPAGRSFAETLTRFSEPGTLSPALLQKVSRASMIPVGISQRALFERFYAETRSLPRRTQFSAAPPAPQPFPPRR